MPTSLPIKGELDKKIGAYNAPLSVTAQDAPNMTVKIRAGSFFNSANLLTEFGGGNSPLIAPPVSAAKWVIVGLTDVGSVTLVHGVNQSAPSLPAIPPGVLALAAVYVTATTTSLSNTVIQDIRPYLRTVDSMPDIMGALAERPTFTDVANDLALKADVDGTVNAVFTLNKTNTVGSPGADAVLSVARGSAPAVAIRWNESIDVWEFTNDGVNYGPIASTNGTYAPLVHYHVSSDVTDFIPAVNELISIATIEPAQVDGLIAMIDEKANETTFAAHAADASIHHALPLPQQAIEGLSTALEGKADLSGAVFTGAVTVQTEGLQPIALVSEDSGSSGLQVNRGAAVPKAMLEWDESSKAWLVGTEGSMNTILTGNMIVGVSEVNGQSGVVVLNAADVGAADVVHTHAIADVDELAAKLDAKVSQLSATVTSSDATPTPLFVFDVPVDDVAAYSIMVTGFNTTTGDSYAVRIFTALKDVSGSIALVSSPQYSVMTDANATSWNVEIRVATNAAIMVTGAAGQTIKWKATVQSV